MRHIAPDVESCGERQDFFSKIGNFVYLKLEKVVYLKLQKVSINQAIWYIPLILYFSSKIPMYFSISKGVLSANNNVLFIDVNATPATPISLNRINCHLIIICNLNLATDKWYYS